MLLGSAAILVSGVIFLVPFAFIAVTAAKTRQEASLLEFSWPSRFAIVENLEAVLKARDYMLIIAFINSTILTVASVTLLVVFGAMVAFVLQRRASRWNGLINMFLFFNRRIVAGLTAGAVKG